MYSELLAASLEALDGERDRGDPSHNEPLLRRQLAQSRRRMGGHGRHPSGQPSALDAPGDIALQLNYDMALIRLGRLYGITCDAALFTRPAVARAWLERELAAVGVELDVGV